MSNPFVGKFGPLLIAEIGGNHEGNFEYAKKLAQLAIEANVDYVKFQIYSGDTLVSALECPDRNRHFKKFELSLKQHQYLAEMVVEAGLKYTSSIWDLDAFQTMDRFISVYKVGSGDLTAYPLLRKIAALEKPIILSTGLSTEEEVLASVAYLQSRNAAYKSPEKLALLQCTSMYPIPASDANLRVMQLFKERTGLTVGYSDHTEGSKALFYAAAMGAEILEFHFTDRREGRTFRDHHVSLLPDEVRALIGEIGLIESYQGARVKQPTLIEKESGHNISFRRAVYPMKDISAGEILTEDNLTVLRPNHGIDARDFEAVLGKVAKVDLKRGQRLEWEMLG